MFRSQTFRQILTDLIVLLAISLIPLFWFPNGYIVTGHDAGYPINIEETFRNRLFTWNSQQNFGIDNTPNIGAVPIHAVEAVFHAFGLPLAKAQQFSFIFWFFLMALSMYGFARSLREDIPFRFFPLVASVFYVLNFYLLAIWRYGSATTFSAYCALPLVLGVLISFLSGKTTVFKAGLFIGMILFIFNGGGGLSVPLFGGLIVGIATAAIYFSLLDPKLNRKKYFVKISSLGLVTFLITAGLNAYWLLPFIYFSLSNYSHGLAASGGAAGVLSWTNAVSKYTSIMNLFRLQGIPEWYDNFLHPFSNAFLSNPLLIAFSFMFAPLAFLSLFFSKEKNQQRLILFFAVLALVGIFFAAGTHPPTGWLFAQFMLHIPGFVIFRSAQYKFIPSVYMSFSVLVAYAISYVAYRLTTVERLQKLKYIPFQALVVVCFIVLMLLYHQPFFRTDFFYYSPPLTTLLRVPEHVIAFDEWSRENLGGESRSLILPRYNSSWKSAVYTWKYFSLYSLFNIIRPRPFIEHSQLLSESQLAYMNRISDEIIHQGPLVNMLSEFLGIRYVLLTKDIDFTLDGMRTEDPSVYQQPLAKYPVIWENGPWQLYALPENNYLGKLYFTSGLTKFIGFDSDGIGALINGSNNFYIADEKANPEALHLGTAIPTVNMMIGAKCESCIMENPVNNLEAPYSLILPGSAFYRLKQWKESSLEDARLPVSQLVTNKLGLSLKRVSDISSLIALKKSETHVNKTIEVLSSYWKYIGDIVLKENPDTSNYGLLRQVEDYAASEKSILLKNYNDTAMQSARSGIANIINDLSKILLHINDIRSVASRKYSYHIPTSFERGEFFLDTTSLPKDERGEPIAPTKIYINDAQFTVNPKVENERMSLGVFDLKGITSMSLYFPDSKNILANRRIESVVAFGGTNSCLVADVLPYDSRKRYKLRLNDPMQSPIGASIYLVKRKNDIKDQPEKSVNFFTNPDASFPIDRTSKEALNFYFSGSDGDVGAMIYYCSNVEKAPIDLVDTITIEELYSPSLFISAKGQDFSNATTQTASFEQIDQTKYRLKSDSKEWPSVLVFNENYDKKWKLYDVSNDTGKFPIFPKFMETWFREPLPERNHFVVNGYANAWLLFGKPKGDLVLEYYPQQLFYKGIAITISSVIIFIIIYIKMRKPRN